METFPAEINPIVIAGWRGIVPPGSGTGLLASVMATVPLLYASVLDLLTRAYEIATLMQRTIYDCLYIAPANQEGREFVAADNKLV